MLSHPLFQIFFGLLMMAVGALVAAWGARVAGAIVILAGGLILVGLWQGWFVQSPPTSETANRPAPATPQPPTPQRPAPRSDDNKSRTSQRVPPPELFFDDREQQHHKLNGADILPSPLFSLHNCVDV